MRAHPNIGLMLAKQLYSEQTRYKPTTCAFFGCFGGYILITVFMRLIQTSK